MNYTVKGFITEISEVETLANGAKKLHYLVKTDNEYDKVSWKFEIYKGADHAEHAEKFSQYNKVGDRVEVEFNIRPTEWQGKHFVNLTHWKCTKLTDEENALQSEAIAAVQQDDDLPF